MIEEGDFIGNHVLGDQSHVYGCIIGRPIVKTITHKFGVP